MSEQPQQASFEGYALVEMMGHRKEIGFVKTEYFGGTALFRCDTQGLEEREFTLKTPTYIEGEWMAAGTKVRREALPAKTCYIAPGSLYAMTPCTEQAALEAIEAMVHRPLIVVDAPKKKELAAGEILPGVVGFECCSGNTDDGHSLSCKVFNQGPDELDDEEL